MTTRSTVFPDQAVWEGDGTHRIPFFAYTSEALYRQELERFFYQAHWCYVGLEAEVPKPGDFKRTVIGERSVILARDAEGVQIDTATASFAIAGDVSGPAGGIGLSVGRAAYAPGDVVTLSFRAQNLSASDVIRLPEVVLTITGPGGYNQQRSFPYDDLFVGAFVDGQTSADAANAAGTYTATARLRSRLTGFEYATDTATFERLVDNTANIQGFVDVAVAALTIGQPQNCLYTARNRGTTAQLGMSMRRSVVQLDTGMVRSQQAFTADLIPGADYVASVPVDTTGYSAGDHACVLEIANGAGWHILDSEPFTLNGLPTPDIVVNPVFGLVTSESGSSVEFSVRLTTAPTADVVIPLSVSDATEFRLPVTSLTFTPANWQLRPDASMLAPPLPRIRMRSPSRPRITGQAKRSCLLVTMPQGSPAASRLASTGCIAANTRVSCSMRAS